MSSLADIVDVLEPEAITQAEWADLTAGPPVPLTTAAPPEPPAIPSTQQAQNWRLAAACRGLDPKLFFPERGEDASTAKAVCARCPVRAECLADGFAEKSGIWGGTSERERRQLRRTRPLKEARLSTHPLDQAQ
jgi:WhiB family redox-sensing transcriptional regulator